jgi:hypothetical protein
VLDVVGIIFFLLDSLEKELSGAPKSLPLSLSLSLSSGLKGGC